VIAGFISLTIYIHELRRRSAEERLTGMQYVEMAPKGLCERTAQIPPRSDQSVAALNLTSHSRAPASTD